MSADLAASRATIPRPLHILLWCVQALLALVFVNSAWAKFTSTPETVALFAAIGVGQWLRYVTALLELTGAVMIVVPRTARIGSALLTTVMLGALIAHLFILHVSPALPAALLLMCAGVVWGRRRRASAF